MLNDDDFYCLAPRHLEPVAASADAHEASTEVAFRRRGRLRVTDCLSDIPQRQQVLQQGSGTSKEAEHLLVKQQKARVLILRGSWASTERQHVCKRQETWALGDQLAPPR